MCNKTKKIGIKSNTQSPKHTTNMSLINYKLSILLILDVTVPTAFGTYWAYFEVLLFFENINVLFIFIYGYIFLRYYFSLFNYLIPFFEIILCIFLL